MSTVGWDTDSGTTDGEVSGEGADFAAFPGYLHFFLGVSVFLEFVDMWNDVEWEWVGEDFVLGYFHFSAEDGAGSFFEFVHTFLSCTRCSLVGLKILNVGETINSIIM